MGAKLEGLFRGESRFAKLEFSRYMSRANLPPIDVLLIGSAAHTARVGMVELRIPATAESTFEYEAPLGPTGEMVTVTGRIRLIRTLPSVGNENGLHVDLDVDANGPLPNLTMTDSEPRPDVIEGEITFAGIRAELTIGDRFELRIPPLKVKWPLFDLTELVEPHPVEIDEVVAR